MKSLLFSILFLSVPIVPIDADDVLGVWSTDDGKAKIQIYKQGDIFNGKIIWLRDSLDQSGKPRLDKENPQNELRTRPIVGINLVRGFRFEGKRWSGGEIYDPENGKTYACRMTLKRDKLEVRGVIGLSMFGRTVVWTRSE